MIVIHFVFIFCSFPFFFFFFFFQCRLYAAVILMMNNYKLVKLAILVESDPMAPFLIATTPRCRGGRYIIVLCVKQSGIKHHILSFWYDSTWD